MSNCNCVEKNPRNRNNSIASARFCYPLSFCHKDRQCFHLTDRRKEDCWMITTTTVFFVYPLPQFIAFQDMILALCSRSLLIQISSPHCLCCHVYTSDIHSSQTHCALQPDKEEKMPELFGEISRMGEKRSQAQQRISQQHRISTEFVLPACNQMLCLSTHHT